MLVFWVLAVELEIFVDNIVVEKRAAGVEADALSSFLTLAGF